MEHTQQLIRPTELPARQPLPAKALWNSFHAGFPFPGGISCTEHLYYCMDMEERARNMEVGIHPAVAALLGQLCYPLHIFGFSVSWSEKSPALGTLGASQAEVTIATVRLGAGSFSEQARTGAPLLSSPPKLW